jgi:glycosyltransferase involved in cell wall biosynthesis
LTIDRHRISDKNGRSLRICFISHQYPPGVGGGIGRFTSDLAGGFAAAGHDVHVVSSQNGAPAVIQKGGVWVHRVGDSPAMPEAIRDEAAGGHLSRLGLVYREVMRMHLVQPFDIVSSPIWLAEGLLVAMDSLLISVLSLHTSSKTLADIDASWREYPGSGPLTVLEAQCVVAHSHTHANSNAAVSKIAGEYSPPNGVVVIPHGVTDQSRRVIRTRRDQGQVRVLVVGRLEMRKGADILLDIIPEILSRYKMVEFVLAGAADPIAELRRQTLPAALQKRLGARSNFLRRVDFAGVVTDDELYRHYADADILLVPSRYESFGLPVIEAMSFGLPVIAWKAGGVGETVVDSETGILVDVGDRHGLVVAVGRLAMDSGARRRYGAAARARYLSHFSTGVSVPRSIDVYRKIVETSAVQVEASLPFQRDALAVRFATVIESVTALRDGAALRTARQLIDGDGLDRPIQTAPRVGVIVTCFNYARYVIDALDSVLAQTHRDFDCVVVDDASTDDSAEIILRWIAGRNDGRFRLVRHAFNRGQMASFATGLAACDGGLVAFLDADDFWFPDFLQHHVAILQGGTPAAATSCSDLVQVDDRGRMLSGTFVGLALASRTMRGGFLDLDQSDLVGPNIKSQDVQPGATPEAEFVAPGYLNHPWNVTSGMMFRRSVLDAVMPRDPESVRICADGYIFLLCHYIAGSFAIGQPLAAYRRHGKNQFSFLPVLGTGIIAPADSAQHQVFVIIRAMLQHLLDAPPKLTALLPLRRRQKLIRTLVRRCLRAGIPVDYPRVRHVLGWSRVLRDRLRAKVWFLGLGLP